MGRQKELMLNTIIIGIGKFSTQIVSVFLLPIYTTMLSTAEYGTYDLLYTIAMFLIPVITLLMEESMFRFLIDSKSQEETTKIISQTIIFAISSTIIWSILIIIIGNIINMPYILTFCFYIMSSIVVSIRNAIIRGKGKIKVFTIINFITSVFIIILNILFIVVFRIGVVGLFLSSIIANITVSIIAFFKLHMFEGVSLKHYDKNLMKEMVKYSIPLVPNSISWSIINFSDRIVVSTILGTSQNGIYSMANKFPTYIDNIYNFFYTAWKEASAKALHYENPQEFYNQIYNVLKRFLIAVVLGSIALLPFIFSFFIKKDFSEAYIYVPILILATYFSNLSSFVGGIFTAYKDTKIIGKTTIIAAIINLLVNIVFIKNIGLWAAAVSTLIAMLINYYIRCRRIKKYVELKSDYIEKTSIIFLIIDLISYYNDKLFFNVINFIIILCYCIYVNRKMLISIILEITKKFSNKKQINNNK